MRGLRAWDASVDASVATVEVVVQASWSVSGGRRREVCGAWISHFGRARASCVLLEASIVPRLTLAQL